MKWNATLNRAQVEIDEVIAERLTVEAMEIDGDSAEVSVAWPTVMLLIRTLLKGSAWTRNTVWGSASV